MKRIVSLILVLCMTAAVFPMTTLFAAAEETDYVTEGLVSLYEGAGHGPTETVWEDSWGQNDITDIPADENTHFTDDAYRIVNNRVALPTALLNVVKGSEFTVEFVLGEVASYDPTAANYLTLLANNPGLTSEKLALYLQLNKGAADKLIFKTSGISSRPTVASGATALVNNSTVSFVYKDGGRASIYVNGVLQAESAAPETNGNNVSSATTFYLSDTDASKASTVDYKGLRFYGKALTAIEIGENYAVDCGNPVEHKELRGDYITRGLVSLYNGVGYTPSSTTWKDEFGTNDITGLVPNAEKGVGFTDEGWRSVGTAHNMPVALNEVLASSEFTVEMRLGDVMPLDTTTNGYVTFLCNTGSEYFSFYILLNKGASDQLYVKTSGLGSSARPRTSSGGVDYAANSTLTITYKAGDKACLYADGVLLDTRTANASNTSVLSNMTGLIFGHANANNDSDTVYKGFRFYTAALTATEIAHNYAADGTISPVVVRETDYVSDGLVSLYTIEGRDPDDPTVWHDGWGKNDITGLGNDEKAHFTDEGFYLSERQYTFPTADLNVLKGDAFTLEVVLGEVSQPQSAQNYIPFICNTGSEKFSFYIQTSSNADKLIAKTSGLGTRPQYGPGALELCNDSTVTLTYEVNGKACVYIDGVLYSEVNANTANGNNADTATGLIFGNASSGKLYNALFKGFRFYDRALTAEEVQKNSFIDDPEKTTDLGYVSNGLVSLYSGACNARWGHDEEPTVWKDLVGHNDVSVALSDSVYFTEDALHLDKAEFFFPEAILEVINGEAFTVEMSLGEFIPYNTTFSTFLNTTGNDNFALFYRASSEEFEFKCAGNVRPILPDGVEVFEDSTVSITFSHGEKIKVYIDGWFACEADATSLTNGLGTLKFGNADGSRWHVADYQSFRFYTRALSDAEIKQNAALDGHFDPDKPQPKPFASIEQPKTNIVGDIAFSEYVTSEAKLQELLSSEVIPANFIFYVDADLHTVDENGENPFSTVEGVFASLGLRAVPTFYVKDEATADAVATYLSEQLISDAFVMSDDPALVKRARTGWINCRGIIDCSGAFDETPGEEEMSALRRMVNGNYAKVVVLPAGVMTKETVDWLNDRALTVWLDCGGVEDKTEALNALLSGTYGIVSSSTEFIYDVCQTYVPENTLTRAPVNVAHRGLHNVYTENTLEAIIAADEDGAEMVEIDIWLTTDGEIAICHNSTTGGIYNENVSIETKTADELRALYSERTAGGETVRCHFPILRDVFEALEDSDMRFLIEIKSAKEAISATLRDLIEEYEMYDRCTVITFSTNKNVEYMMRDYPEMPVFSLFTISYPDDPDEAASYVQSYLQKVNAVADPQYTTFSEDIVEACLKRGMTVWTWTISTESAIHPRYDDGYSGITGDNCSVISVLPTSLEAQFEETAFRYGQTYTASIQTNGYRGIPTDVSGEATFIVVSGSADVDGNKVTPTATGELVLLPVYTKQLSAGSPYVLCGELLMAVVDEPEGLADPAVLDGGSYTVPGTNCKGERVTLLAGASPALSGRVEYLYIPSSVVSLAGAFTELTADALVLKNTVLDEASAEEIERMAAVSPVTVYCHKRTDGGDSVFSALDGKENVTVRNLLSALPTVKTGTNAEGKNTVTVFGALSANDLSYDKITVTLTFEADGEAPKTFTQEYTTVFRTLIGYASVDETTALAQNIYYAEGASCLAGLTIRGVPAGTYDLSVAVYATVDDADGEPIEVCSDPCVIQNVAVG